MKKAITLLLSMATTLSLFSQSADFENFNLGTDEFLNGSDGSGGFQSGLFFFPNLYNDAWESWSGWAVSSMTDVTTPGFGNQYSCIAGVGAESSTAYAVSFVLGKSAIPMPMNNDPFTFPGSVEINNSTYAYLSMLEGDNYAKKFGGIDGNDPDYFLLTIKGYVNGAVSQDSIDFYLADYRFSDNSMDYIVDQWTSVNLMALGHVDSLFFTLSSSDVGVFGMNTPAYFCLDNLTLGIAENTNDQLKNADIKIFPNPASEELSIDWQEHFAGEVGIYSVDGKLIQNAPLNFGVQKMDVRNLSSGMYFVKIQTEEGWLSRRFLKE